MLIKLGRIALGLMLLTPWVGCGGVDEVDSTPEVLGRSSEELQVGAAPCRSSNECGAGAHCTTEDGVCNRPPGCRPGGICAAVCFGTCEVASVGTPCGTATCSESEFCCNESCSICAPLDGVCTQQFCEPDAPAPEDACTGVFCPSRSHCELGPSGSPTCVGDQPSCGGVSCASFSVCCNSQCDNAFCFGGSGSCPPVPCQ